MAEVKKYFYLKLKDNFYNTDDIKLLEAMPNGYEYSSLYLKLCLMSLKEEGKLLYKGRIPYKPEMIATITGHNVDTVKVAIDTLVQLEMIVILDSGTIFINDIQALIGKGSSEAERKKKYRDRIKNEGSKNGELGQCPGHRPPELELELENRDKKHTPPKNDGDESFEKFWNMYGKKEDRKKCLAKWKRLPLKTRTIIFEKLPAYILATPDRQYRKNPATYLNNECWNNEIIERKQNAKNQHNYTGVDNREPILPNRFPSL